MPANTGPTASEAVESKIPAVTLLFWVMKIAATTLGETAGDLLSMTWRVGYALSSAVLLAFFVISVAAQLRARKYYPALYWTVILSTSTAGTTMSDYMDRTLGLGYAKGSLLLVTILAAVFVLWRFTARSFAVENIRSFKVEALYWTAIFFSNTLGTALGDFLADSSGLGFAGGALLIGAALAVIVVLHYATRISKTLLFWLAFVLTRPFGATVGDVLTKPHARGGLGFGTVGSSAILGAVLVALVVYTTVQTNTAARQQRVA